MADFFKPICEFLALSEQLLKARKTASHRAAARINDLCIGQDHMDEANMPEVIRHFIDEIGRAQFSVYHRVADIGFAEFGQFLMRQFGKIGRIFRLLINPPTAAQFMRERKNIGQFHRALNLTVRRQNLLQQRGTCARQPENEDRVCGTMPSTCLVREKRWRTMCNLAVNLGCDPSPVIADFFTFQTVSSLIIGEGVFILSAVLQRFAQCETEVIAIRKLRLWRGLTLAHRCNLFGIKSIGFEVGKAPIGIAKIGLDAIGLRIGLNRVFLQPGRFERMTQG